MVSRKFFRLILIACTFLSVEGKSQPSVGTKDIYYEIFVRSFYDSNGDGIGDLNGITSKLDYLKNLGITGIWLTPFNNSPSYHKYDVTNYESVDPEYGTIDDFKRLVSEAHKRGIRILMDLVVNHTSTQNDWFLKALQNDSVYFNYYVWQEDPNDTLKRNWNIPRGKSALPTDEKYFSFFSPDMPDLNYDNPAVRQSIIGIGKWWIQNTGLDGYRLDAAQHIYDPGTPQKNTDWWKQFTDSLKKVKPNVITIGEVWNTKKNVGVYLQGLTGCFNFELSWSILKSLQANKNDSLVEKLLQTYAIYNHYSTHYLDPVFLSNHDQDRIMSDLNNDTAKARLAAAIYLTLPGTPFIYYGEEIGMRGKKPDEQIREPFLWSATDTSGSAHWEKAHASTFVTVRPLDEQMKEPTSIYNFYLHLIQLRKRDKALTSSSMQAVDAGNEQALAYLRGDSRNEAVLHNMSAQEMTIKLTGMLDKFNHVIWESGNSVTVSKQAVVLPAYSSVVLKK